MNRLETHYKEKYQQETNFINFKEIKNTNIPANRLEAAIHFFPKFFNGNVILEIGAGSGDIAYNLEKYGLSFQKYILNDISESRIEGLKKKFNNPKFEVSKFNIDFEDIPVDNLDAIIMIALIEHLIDPIEALKKCYDKLNENGIIYIETPNIATYFRRKQLLLGKFPSTASKDEGLITFENRPVDLYDEGHLHYFTFRSLSELLKRVGFKEIYWLGYCNSKQILGKKVMNFLAKRIPTLFSDVLIVAKK